MKQWLDLINSADGVPKTCPSCGGKTISTRIENTTISYGENKAAVEIPVQIPVHRCDACEIDFTDELAETIKHAAICNHLGVMTPDDVAGVREMYGLSRAEFAGITRLGEASIARWEAGNVIQNAAYDQFLYLLTYPDNIARLQSREREQRDSGAISLSVAAESESEFCALKDAGLLQRKKSEAQHFVLRKAS